MKKKAYSFNFPCEYDRRIDNYARLVRKELNRLRKEGYPEELLHRMKVARLPSTKEIAERGRQGGLRFD